MATKRKRLCLKEKIEILEYTGEYKKSIRHLAAHFKIGRTQAANILNSKEELYRQWREHGNEKIKNKFSTYGGQEIDSVVYEWFCAAQSKYIPVSGTMIKEKALQVAWVLGIKNFKASNGWLEKFRNRHSISFKAICGGAAYSNISQVSKWKDKLSSMCKNYSKDDIYNVDETGLFFKAFPNRTMCLRDETCQDGKICKERLTVMLCVNMAGKFENPLIIGKSAKPHCLKGIDLSLFNVEYFSNKCAWMTRDVMTAWLLAFDRKLGIQKRKVILFLDNAISHPQLILTNIELVFFPPDALICQPLGQGIIKNFKVNYRQCILRCLLSKMDGATTENDISKSINVLDAISWINSSIKEIKSQVVYNCFCKAGFSKNELNETMRDETLPDTEGLEGLTQLMVDVGATDVSVEHYLLIDDRLATEMESNDISEILQAWHQDDDGSQQDSESDSEVLDESITTHITNYSQALKHLNDIKNFSYQMEDGKALKIINDLKLHFELLHSRRCQTHMTRRCVQTRMTEFFKSE